jgi:hypothetical protein
MATKATPASTEAPLFVYNSLVADTVTPYNAEGQSEVPTSENDKTNKKPPDIEFKGVSKTNLNFVFYDKRYFTQNFTNRASTGAFDKSQAFTMPPDRFVTLRGASYCATAWVFRNGRIVPLEFCRMNELPLLQNKEEADWMDIWGEVVRDLTKLMPKDETLVVRHFDAALRAAQYNEGGFREVDGGVVIFHEKARREGLVIVPEGYEDPRGGFRRGTARFFRRIMGRTKGEGSGSSAD